MTTESEPVIGQWYYHLDKGQSFAVVAIDEENSVVEVQHFDGDVEEIPLDEWADLDIELSEAPENWTGPIDIGSVDDLGTGITDTPVEVWAQSLREIRKPDEEKLFEEDEEVGERVSREELKGLRLDQD